MNPFVEAELDRLNRNSLIIVCLVLLYGIAIRVKPDAAVDPQDSQIQVSRFAACSQARIFFFVAGHYTFCDECGRASIGAHTVLHRKHS